MEHLYLEHVELILTTKNMITRLRNNIFLCADFIFEAKTTVLFLILLFSLLSFMNCCSISYNLKSRYFSLRARQMELSGKYFYQLGFRPDANYSDDKELIRRLIDSDSIDDVICLNYFSGTGVDNSQGKWNSLFVIYNLSASHIDPEKILSVNNIAGEPISSLKPNHILLDDTAKNKYKIGDYFPMWIEYISTDPNIHVEEASIDVVVDGFFSREESVIYTGHRLTDLSSVFTTVYDPIHPIDSMIIDGYPSYYCICSVLKHNNTIINFGESLPLLLIISPEDGVSREELFNDLSECGLNPQETRSYEQLQKSLYEKNDKEQRFSRVIAISITVLSICVLIGTFMSWYTFKRKELAIYVLCGGAWKKCILLSVSPYYFSIIVGGMLGPAVWSIYKRFILNELNNIPVKTILLLILTYCGIYTIVVFIYYILFKHLSPAELYRTKE